MGAGPRATIALLMAAKARALLQKRVHATTDDVWAVALPVLRHRIIPTFNAEAAGIDNDDIVATACRSAAKRWPDDMDANDLQKSLRRGART